MHRSFAHSFLDGGLEEKGLNFLRASLHTMKVCTLHGYTYISMGMCINILR